MKRSGPLPLLLVTVFLNIAGFSLILPLLPFYGLEWNSSPVMIAVLFAAYSFGNIFGEIFWGRRSDRFGRKKILCFTTAAAGLSYVAFAFAPGLYAAILIRVVSGFFSGTISVVQAVIADITPPEQRARNMGFFGAAFNLGFAVGPAIGGLLADPALGVVGFRTPILAAAAFSGCASMWALFALPETRPVDAAQRPNMHYREALEYVAGHPLLLRLFAICFCGIAAFASMEAIFGLWTEKNFDWSTDQLGWVFLAMGGSGLLVQIFAIGPLVARFRESGVIMIGLGLLVVSMLAPPLLQMPSVSAAMMALMMVGHSLAFPNAGALISRSTPPDRQGSVMGLSQAANATSRILAPPAFAALFSINADLPYYICALMIAAVLVLAAAVRRHQVSGAPS